MTHRTQSQIRQQRSLVLLVVMLALGVRVLYAPFHLAQDEHLQSEGHLALHADESEDQATDGHDHEHDHPPHPALDHASDLIVRRTTENRRSLDSCALPCEARVRNTLAAESLPASTPLPSPPSTRPRGVCWSRGPPASA